ncbi:MAG: PAS domain S-box protein [Phycisphaeraceae bacterium]|nr:PAS domain S-box protein [Phycisphaerales bacterium]QOJ16915.1 MAG: PAS domain S-box protein [Phycisphaeraceae bacterium]
MPPAPLPDNEADRLSALLALNMLDSPREADFDDLTALAAHLCDAPIAVISLVDSNRQWFKSCQGLDVSQTPRGVSFCAYAILNPAEPLIVPDATLDPRFADSPLVTGDPGIRFYAGIPLVLSTGEAIGSLCVIDRRPRTIDERRVAMLRVVAHQVTAQMELRRNMAALERQDEALRQSEERHRAIIDTALDAVITIDERGRITGWNREAERMFGYRSSEVLGSTLDEKIIPPAHRSAHREGLRRYLETGEQRVLNRRIELTAIDRTGREFPVELAICHAGRGDHHFFSAFLRDISERKRGVEALRKAMLEAQAANRAKSDFLANMSHEIRTPMTAILGYADLLRSPDLAPAEHADHLQTIRRNGEHLLQILNDILDLSKIESGRMEIEHVPVDVSAVLGDVMSLMRLRATEKRLTLRLDYETPIPSAILGDPTRLRQILLNLVGNAVKFTDSGSVTVTARLDEHEPGGPWLELIVADTGIGMTVEQIGRLFQPFTQGDETMTRRFGGTGLGLTICHRLALGMGGSLEVASTPNRGSTFTLRVPTGPIQNVPRVTAPADGVLADSDPKPDSVCCGEQPPRVLLAEDGPDNQRLIAHILRRAGCEVTIANNGREAVEAVTRCWGADRLTAPPFDLILMDMQMPELDGYGAARELRRRGYPGRIVALTAHAMSDDRARCLAAGCDDYAPKPIDRAALIALVRPPVRSTSSTSSQTASTT